MNIISISGKKHSGKTTVATLAKEILQGYDSDLDVAIFNWADALKQEVCDACKITPLYLEENKANFRLILQGWGTDFRRRLCGTNYWVERLLFKLAKIPHDNNTIIIIPDTRFINEIEALRQLSAIMWKVDRSKEFVDNGYRLIPQDTDTHQSETEWEVFNKWDKVIENYNSLGHLRSTVRSALESCRLIK